MSPTTPTTTVLVLADRDDVREVAGWLRAHGHAIEDVDRSHDELACVRVRTADDCELAVLGDHVGDVVYVTVVGAPALATAWVSQLAGRFTWVGPTEVLATLRDDAGTATPAAPSVWIGALSRLAVLRGELENPAMLAAWTAALAHPVTAVRRAAIRTCHGTRWPGIRAALEARLAVEPDLQRGLRSLLARLQDLS